MTKASGDGGIDLWGVFDFDNEDEKSLKASPFLMSIIRRINESLNSTKLSFVAECKLKENPDAVIPKDIVKNICMNFNGKNFHDEFMQLQFKQKVFTHGHTLLKFIFTSTDICDAGRKLTLENNIIIRNGLQLSWDFIILSSDIRKEFDQFFDDKHLFKKSYFLDFYNK